MNVTVGFWVVFIVISLVAWSILLVMLNTPSKQQQKTNELLSNIRAELQAFSEPQPMERPHSKEKHEIDISDLPPEPIKYDAKVVKFKRPS